MLGQPIFPGDSGVDQLVEIIKVLGTPTREQASHLAVTDTTDGYNMIYSSLQF